MMRINSVTIIGAGALGLLFGEYIAARTGIGFSFLADDSRYERMKEGCFLINGKKRNFRISRAKDLAEKPDLIIVAVKNHHLSDIIPLLEAAVTRGSIICSLLNGIDSEVFLEKHFPEANIIYTVAVGMDAVKEDNQLRYSTKGRLLLGVKDNGKDNPVLTAVKTFLTECGIENEVPDDIHRSLWWKWMINIGVNQVSAVTGAVYGIFHKDRGIQLLMESAMFETVRVAQACGADLRAEDIPNWYPILNGLGAEGKTSMLQDIEAKRKTEADCFSGRLIELAEKHGIAVPVNETLYRVIKTKELIYSR